MYPHADRVARQRMFPAAPYPLRLSALAVMLSFSILPGHAQEPAVLPPVEVKGSYDESIGTWDAASQGAVTKEVIEKRPILRPAEVLENVPGMVVTQHSGDGKANQYFLRGYNLDHGTDFATWVAGMPVNMPTHAHGQGYTDLNFLIPELITRVVYSKGPYFAEDGDFSSVGSARIHYAERLANGIAALTGGSFGYGRAVLTGSPDFGAGRLVYGLEYQHSDGPWDNPSRFHKTNGVLRYAQGTEPNGFNITAMGYRASWNSTDQIPQRAVDSGLIGLYGTIDPTDGGRSERYSLSGEWRQSEGGVNRAASVYLIRSRLNLFSNFTFFLDDPVNGDQFEQAEKRLVAGGSASQTWFLKSGERQIWNTLGAQARRDRIEPVGLYSTVARERLATTRQDDVTVTSVAPYFSNTIAWTSWFRTIAGLRADYVDMDVASDNPVNSGKAHDFLWSPKLSLVFGPWSRDRVFRQHRPRLPQQRRPRHDDHHRSQDRRAGGQGGPAGEDLRLRGWREERACERLDGIGRIVEPGAGFGAAVRGRRRDHGAQPSVAALRARAPHAISADAGPRARPVAGVHARALPRRGPRGQLHTRRA